MAQRKLYSRYDALIVGSGIAGLLLALELDRKGMRTALVCKGRLSQSNTSWAQGGIAICTGINPLDDPTQHLSDTLAAGQGLSDRNVAAGILEEGPSLFAKLEELGLNFDKTNGKLDLAREGGHSQARVLHSKDASGKAISEILIAALRNSHRVAIFENMFALDLLSHGAVCVGLRALYNDRLVEILSPRVVLATGGLGQVFSRTTNPSITTGDGIAMAYRAGAKLVDMEFVQFHPTALYLPAAPASLISEAVRGAGAHLVNKKAERFAFRFHKDGELATRDLVSRAIMSVMQEERSPCVYLDMRPIGARRILQNFPNIVESCRTWGIDPLEQAIPVSPAAHYFMGGIWTDEYGRSSLPGLYAIGECASTGLHGANRLASNSLLEGGVMALRLAALISGESRARLGSNISLEESIILSPPDCSKQADSLKAEMFNSVGICREGAVLQDLYTRRFSAAREMVPLEESAVEAANLSLLSELILCSALAREESRGAHYRLDFPKTDEMFLKRYFVSRKGTSWSSVLSPVAKATPMILASH